MIIQLNILPLNIIQIKSENQSINHNYNLVQPYYDILNSSLSYLNDFKLYIALLPQLIERNAYCIFMYDTNPTSTFLENLSKRHFYCFSSFDRESEAFYTEQKITPHGKFETPFAAV